MLAVPFAATVLFADGSLLDAALPAMESAPSAGSAAEGLTPDAVRPAPSVSAESPIRSVDAAVAAFAEFEKMLSHPRALRTAMEAYLNYRTGRPDEVRKPYFFFVDLGLDNRTPRGFVFDMEKLALVDGPFMVAHGRGSSPVRDGVPTTFSDREGSNASSLGVYLAEETYSFSGSSGGSRYTSVGLRLRGESGPFNGAARRRGIVSHGAPYVTPSGAGRSEGCPAMEPDRAERLLPLLADGGVVFVYSPNDPRWLEEDPWL
jgi:hypothetical protein